MPKDRERERVRIMIRMVGVLLAMLAVLTATSLLLSAWSSFTIASMGAFFVAMTMAILSLAVSARFLFTLQKRPRQQRSPDEFWEKNTIRMMIFIITASMTLVVVSILIFLVRGSQLGERLLQFYYYLFVLLGAAVGATMAAWRGRQFEKRLVQQRFSRAEEIYQHSDAQGESKQIVSKKGEREEVFSNVLAVDRFLERDAYRSIFIFGVAGVAILSASSVISLRAGAPEFLRGASYFLLFISAVLGGLIATWRGRQFADQQKHTLSESQKERFERALEMALSVKDKARSMVGFTLLDQMKRDGMSIDKHETLYYASWSFFQMSGRQGKVFLAIQERAKNSLFPIRVVEEFVESLPPSEAFNAFYEVLSSSSDALCRKYGDITPSQKSSEKGRIVLYLPLRPSEEEATYNMYSQVTIGAVTALAGYIRKGESLKIYPDRRANQRKSFHFNTKIISCTMQNVDFGASFFCDSIFGKTDLTNSSFNDAVLYNVTFRTDTNLRGVSFDGANITACNFEETKNFLYPQVEGAYWLAPKEHILEDLWSDPYAPKFPRWWADPSVWGGDGLPAFVASLRRDSVPEEDAGGGGDAPPASP